VVGVCLAASSAGAAVAFTTSGSELKVSGDAAANEISVLCDAGATTVQGDGATMSTPIACSSLSRLEVTADDGDDVVGIIEVTPGSGFSDPTLPGNIFIEGDDGRDKLDASRGLLTFLYGGSGNDRLFGHRANDSMSGAAGADLIKGNGGADFIKGKSGGDDLVGGKGIDFILGGVGRDSISGGKRIDCLRGGAGGDRISSGPGRDSVGGGPGRDRINQGPPPGDVFSEARCSAAAL